MSIDYSNFAIPKPTQKKKKKRKDYTDIPKKVKEIVWERDKHRCIFCHKTVDLFYANAHFIPRGLGRTSEYQKTYLRLAKIVIENKIMAYIVKNIQKKRKDI